MYVGKVADAKYIGFGTCAMLAFISFICLLGCTGVELIVEADASIRGCRKYQTYFKTDSIEMRKIRFFLGVAT